MTASDDPPLETVDQKKRSVKYAKPALWRRVLGWILGKLPEPKSGSFGG